MFLILITSLCLAQEPDINWYSRPGSKDESVLEICFEDKECHKLIHKTENSNKEHIKRWVDDIIKIKYRIEDKYGNIGTG